MAENTAANETGKGLTPHSSDKTPSGGNPDELDRTKALMRDVLHSRRSALAEEAPDDVGLRLAEHFFAAISFKPGQVVSGFWPIRSEINLRPLLWRLVSEHAVVALPVMTGPGKPLLFRRWQPADEMSKASFGVQEPLESAPEVIPDIMIIPLLGFDRQGNRIGYGGGFYDRTLQQASEGTIAIGAAFAGQEVPGLPHGPTDRPLHGIVTEDGYISTTLTTSEDGGA